LISNLKRDIGQENQPSHEIFAMSESCTKRKNKQLCEAGGLMAKFFACKWHESFGCVSLHSLPKEDEPKAAVARKAKLVGSKTSDTKKPDDCEVPACKSKTSAFAKLIKAPKSKRKHTHTPKAFAHAGQCPPGREDLGWQSWTLLHSVAAHYPDMPSEEDRTRAQHFVESVGHLYPCTHCAEEFREDMKENPVRLESRKSFSVWMCRMHNTVNRKLGKEEFPCTIDVLDSRWRKNEVCEEDSHL
jgi:FAD-linked sulfhydryl oxidase